MLLLLAHLSGMFTPSNMYSSLKFIIYANINFKAHNYSYTLIFLKLQNDMVVCAGTPCCRRGASWHKVGGVPFTYQSQSMKIATIFRILVALGIGRMFGYCFALPQSSICSDVSNLKLCMNGNAKKLKERFISPISRGSAKQFLPKKNWLNTLMFDWVKPLMQLGNRRTLQMEDLWILDDRNLMKNTSASFDSYLEAEKKKRLIEPTSKNPKGFGILGNFYDSPLTKATIKLYGNDFFISGVLKLLNTLVQFTPSLLIARILKLIEKNGLATQPAAFSSEGLVLSLLLLSSLNMKTFLENQYFSTIMNLGSTIRGALSSAVYRKSLKLSPSGRQNSTVGEIVNYMQLDTSRLEYVAVSIHVVWDGLLQVSSVPDSRHDLLLTHPLHVL